MALWIVELPHAQSVHVFKGLREAKAFAKGSGFPAGPSISEEDLGFYKTEGWDITRHDKEETD